MDEGFVAGFDVSYSTDGQTAVACLAIFDPKNIVVQKGRIPVVDFKLHRYGPPLPYEPGNLYGREREGFEGVMAQVSDPLAVVAIDGNGSHFDDITGCRFGEEFGVPTFGIAKSPRNRYYEGLGEEEGSLVPVVYVGEFEGKGQQFCYALRTRQATRPIFISEGHQTNLDEIVDITLRFSIFRRPELIRRPDYLSREHLRTLGLL